MIAGKSTFNRIFKGVLHGGAVAACAALLAGWAALPGYAQTSCAPSSTVSLWSHSGGAAAWSSQYFWSPAGVPNNASTSVCIIDNEATAAFPTEVDVAGAGADESVNNLTIGKYNVLSIGQQGSVIVFGPTVSNAGTIDISQGSLVLSGPNTQPQFIQGGGTITLANGTLRSAISTFTNTDNTIQGSGQIMATFGDLLNDTGGTIDANVPGKTLNISNQGGPVTNDGTFEAEAGSTLIADGVANFSNSTLTGGTWRANGTIEINFNTGNQSGGEITTNNANIILDGANGGAAAIVDLGGFNTLSALANNEGALTLENGAGMNLSTNLANSGAINVGAGSTLTLTGGYSETALGATNVNGTLSFEGHQVQLGYGSINAGPSGQVQFSNGAAVVGGFLMGSGNYSVSASEASFVATTIDNGANFSVTGALSSNLTPVGAANFTNVTNNGAVTVSSFGTLNWNGGSNADSGSLTVGTSGTANVTSFTSSGVMTIDSGGLVANSGTNLTLGGGSRTYIEGSQTFNLGPDTVTVPGGALSTVAGTTIELNGGLLDNNGTVSGTLDVNYGGLAEGAGVYGAVNVTNGGAFHPGNSPGIATSSSATWGAGGAYQFSINSANGTPGTNWSLWNVTGNLDITAGTTPNSQFTIDIDSLLANDSAGLLTDFNPDDSYSWLIASAGSVTGFNAADFAFDTAGFANALDGGTFSLADSSASINLIFTPQGGAPTPEPSALLLFATGLVGLGALFRRRRA